MSELSIRRNNLFNLMKEGSIAVIHAGVSKISSEDAYYQFVVNKNFFYFTNVEQENSVLVLIKGVGERKIYLFVDEYSELKEKWTGRRLTFEEASQISDIQNVYSTNNLENIISLALAKENNQYGSIDTLYMDLSPEIKIADELSTTIYKEQMKAKYPEINIIDVKPMITALRMVKSEEEIANIRQAIYNTGLGINKLMVDLKPGLYEYQLADNFEFYGRNINRSKLAFSTIVASGKNATCLHYPSQNSTIKPNDMVLFDLGYSYRGYSADISRTYPVSGVYSGICKTIYEVVLKCNKAVIEYAHAGLTLKDLQDYTKEFLKNECVRVGLMGEDEDIIKHYYHNISHHLGLDTHDASNREKPLQQGAVITVEPGLYFDEYGVGVRIEDDIMITENGCEVLSKDIAKEIEDIERLFRSKK